MRPEPRARHLVDRPLDPEHQDTDGGPTTAWAIGWTTESSRPISGGPAALLSDPAACFRSPRFTDMLAPSDGCESEG